MQKQKLTTSDYVYRFKKKYPITIGWRYLKNSEIVEKHFHSIKSNNRNE